MIGDKQRVGCGECSGLFSHLPSVAWPIETSQQQPVNRCGASQAECENGTSYLGGPNAIVSTATRHGWIVFFHTAGLPGRPCMPQLFTIGALHAPRSILTGLTGTHMKHICISAYAYPSRLESLPLISWLILPPVSSYTLLYVDVHRAISSIFNPLAVLTIG